MLNVKKIILCPIILILSACVMEQQQPTGPGQTIIQPSFHPTLTCAPGVKCGVSRSVYTVTELNR